MVFIDPSIDELANYDYTFIHVTNGILDKYNISDYFNRVKNCKKILYLAIKITKINYFEHLVNLFENNSSIENLCIYKCNFSHEDLECLDNIINHQFNKISRVELNHCNIIEKFRDIFCDIFKYNITLECIWIYTHNNQMYDENIKLVEDILSTNFTLVHVVVYDGHNRVYCFNDLLTSEKKEERKIAFYKNKIIKSARF